jgi:hypothetical protein
MNNSALPYLIKEIDVEQYFESIHTLFNNSFGRAVTADQFRWKYTHAQPEKMRVWAAFTADTNELVGCYSAFKQIFTSQEGSVVVYQGSDGMVMPEHRRTRIFHKIIQTVTETLMAEGPAMHFGYCNPISLPAILKAIPNAQAMEAGFVRYYAVGMRNVIDKLPLRGPLAATALVLTSPVKRLLNRLKVLSTPTTLACDTVEDLALIDELHTAAIVRYHILFPPRDARYLNWKTAGAPPEVRNKVTILGFKDANGNYVGYCVYTIDKSRNLLVICSLFCNDTRLYNQALTMLLSIAMRMHVDGMLTNVTSELYHAIYKKFGFLKGNKVLGFFHCLQPEFAADVLRPDFLLQEPIDRDLIDY